MIANANEYLYENLKKERRVQVLYNGVRAIDMQLSQLKLQPSNHKVVDFWCLPLVIKVTSATSVLFIYIELDTRRQ